MSIYAGLSLREIYINRCNDQGIKSNSALVKILPLIPDDYHSLRTLDISKNFLGPRGIIPLLQVIECCTALKTLDFRSQQLDKNAVEVLCGVLRTHPSVISINLSDNPLTISCGALLLDLCKENSLIESIGLSNTRIRGAMLGLIETEALKNRDARRKKIGSLGTNSAGIGTKEVLSSDGRATVASDSGALAQVAAAAEVEETGLTRRSETLCKRASPLEITNALSQFSSTVHPFLFDENPLFMLSEICSTEKQFFYDPQFPVDSKDSQKLDTYIYGMKKFKRASEIYLNAPVFPEGERLDLPKVMGSGFEWIFTCVGASIRTVSDLKKILILPSSSSQTDCGLFGARLFIDGAWRFIFADDFLPVDTLGIPLFTKAVESDSEGGTPREKYIWPCLLEKILAKVHGGFNALDANVSNPESDLYHQLFRDPMFTEVKYSLSSPPRPTTCGRLMADFTGGMEVVRYLHREGFDADAWWKNFEALMSTTPPTTAVAVSRNVANPTPGIDPAWAYEVVQARQINGFRLIQLSCRDSSATWNGSWSEESLEWEEFPEVAVLLLNSRPPRKMDLGAETIPRYKSKITQPASFHTSGKAHSVKKFWIAYPDFLRAFEELHVCRTFHNFNERIVQGAWKCKSAGGHVKSERWYSNPHMHFQVNKKGPCLINLSVPDSRFRKNSIGAIAFHVLRCSQFPILFPEKEEIGHANEEEKEVVVFNPKYFFTESLFFEGVLEAGNYWIIPSTYTAAMCSSFSLRICCISSFTISEENLRDHWYDTTVTCDVGTAGEIQFGESTAQVSIAFSHDKQKLLLSNRSSDTFKRSPEKCGTIIVKAAPFLTEEKSSESVSKVSDSSIALALLESTPQGELSRASGPLNESTVVAKTSFRQSSFVYVDANISWGDRFHIICSAEARRENLAVHFHVWSTIPVDRLTSLPPWSKQSVVVDWPNGSGSYYHATNNPQVEVYGKLQKERMVVRMTMEECDCEGSSAITFFAICNRGRLGGGLQGLVPLERIITQSPYVHHHWVQCEIRIKEEIDSVLLMPCLQPLGSKGKCLMEIYSESGNISVRVLSSP